MLCPKRHVSITCIVSPVDESVTIRPLADAFHVIMRDWFLNTSIIDFIWVNSLILLFSYSCLSLLEHHSIEESRW